MKYPSFYLILFLLSSQYITAQWTNRYPQVDGFGHHVYLEGYELPVMNSGATGPAPSPSGNEVVFSAKGWLWLMDLNTQSARRITSTGAMDFKPNWSPDGKHIVFVRDTGLDTKIMLLDMAQNKEFLLIDTKALDLDPIFSPDGASVYFASAENGSLDIWQLDLATKTKTVLTKAKSLERLPIPLNSKYMIYLKKTGFSYDSIEVYSLDNDESLALAEENFMSQASFSLSSDQRTLAYTWPQDDDYELRLLDIKYPESNLLLTKSNTLPLNPKFSSDNQWIYYSETNTNELSEIKRIRVSGGKPELLEIKSWEWNAPTGTLKITSKVDGKITPVRMSVVDANGHPVVPNTGIIHSEGQNGMVFFYSDGEIELQAPHGELTITAVHGLSTEKTVIKSTVGTDSQSAEINLKTIWNAQANGWYSGDNHFHLNYGGTNQLDPEDIVLDLKAENMDVAFPLLANLGNRFLQPSIWDWKRTEPPLIQFGQEVRSHFLGHLGLLGTKDIYWPWVWGPYYDVYGRDDRLNAEPLEFARNQNALGGYVHPVSVRDPFTENGARRIPIELIADCVLGKSDLIEVGCLWSDEIGTANLWHEILNIGQPLAISGGSDVMNDLYRTMAIGVTRVYVKPDGDLSIPSYLEALKNGRSFVTNGPQILFEVDGKEVGEVINTKSKTIKWTLDVHSPTPFDLVEIFVNGAIVWSKKGNTKAGSKTYKGSIDVPKGGWVTARVSGGVVDWPLMDSYPFAESSPVWFNSVGSTDKEAAKASANKLLRLLSVSTQRLKRGYGDNPIPKLEGHFEEAKQHLESIINQ
ncbi:CehA/McbA family metallohydrolase [Hyunsoonleella sp. SJ7]|uniref:CehA/McbA family metallohydrolase n=1 Tax=Hyunsoonleella aquatilis TaxID=2762758 RepID=A0A923H980_9FLAO|nr:CehA/McbA family metallohydrolase [Hyunsoonleella aquatilis]MBC3757287.1 CehA/McbA family metallohydrolase [Hyunsoonleella aquatilis]